MNKFAVITAVFLCLGACGEKQDKDAENQKPAIKIGATLPLTGNMSHIGVSAQKSLQLALEKWEAEDTRYRYELIVEDDSFDPKKVAMITNKLINQDKVKALFTVFSIGANVASPIAGKAKVIHMTCAYGSQPAEGFYNFNNITQYENQTELMLEELKRRNIKSMAMAISNNIGSTQQAQLLERKIKEDGTIKIKGKEIFNPGTRDFRMIIQKLTANGEPDIFYVDGITPDATLVAKYLRETTGKVNLTTINDFIETVQRSPFEGLWFVESASGTVEFNQKYKNRFDEEVFLCGANLFDNLDLFIWANENTGVPSGSHIPDNDDVVRTLLSVKNRYGAIGSFSIDEEGIVQSEAAVKVIKNGESVKIRE